jgi:PII-like signaling protein
MAAGEGVTRIAVYLTEDDRTGHHGTAELLAERGRAAGAQATIRRGSEGFGASGHLRAERLPDLARGLPLVVELVAAAEVLTSVLADVQELAPGALVTTEQLPSPGTSRAAERLLARAYELARSGLEGINEAAVELADLSGEDVSALDEARRIVAGRLVSAPDHADKQVASLIRRAFELGHWRWEIPETNEVP